MEYIYGKNICKTLIIDNSKVIKKALIIENLEWINLLKQNKVKYEIVSKQFLEDLIKTDKHQGIVLVVEEYQYLELDHLLKKVKNKINFLNQSPLQNQKKFQPLIVILDQIEDPHNFGAILRTCWAVKVDGIIILNRRQVQVNATVAKTSVGALFHVPVSKVTNLAATIKKLKDIGFWVISTGLKAATMYNQIDYNFPIALIVGNEGRGVSMNLLNNSDYLVKIPLYGEAESLNVSVATALMLYQIRSKQS